MSTTTTIFNQYYFDVLRKIRDTARERKYDDKIARGILKACKANYRSWDKFSDEYRAWFAENGDLAAFENQQAEWQNGTWQMYKGVPVSAAARMFNKNPLEFEYYLAILCVFRKELSAEVVKAAVDVLRTVNKTAKEVDDLEGKLGEDGAEIVPMMRRIGELYIQRAASAASSTAGGGGSSGGLPGLGEIENTSIGKLAKEILEDVNVDDLQNTIGKDGDVLSALSNPDSGLLKLVGTVSQKMMAKMASGEIKQETLLQDAMKFASSMPGLGGMANGFNMGDMMKMMGNMMGGGGGNARVDKNKVKRHAMRDRLKKKATQKENMSRHVENEQQ
jgi:hypothetical protein